MSRPLDYPKPERDEGRFTWAELPQMLGIAFLIWSAVLLLFW